MAWTAERLDALPLWSIVRFRRMADHPAVYTAVKTDDDLDCWQILESEDWVPSAWLAGQHDLRVVSVPIDALLSDGAVLAARDDLMHTYRTAARGAIRAAIAYVIGGSP